MIRRHRHHQNGTSNGINKKVEAPKRSRQNSKRRNDHGVMMFLSLLGVGAICCFLCPSDSPRSSANEPSINYNPNNASECGVWFAPSTIPGAGLGMFAGQNFEYRQNLLPSGDIVIPVIDLDLFHGSDWEFLWDEYSWNAGSQGMSHEGVKSTSAISTGFGAAINCFFDLFNVDEDHPTRDYAGLERTTDPGFGAFTPYHDRNATADEDLKAGQELFTDYGTSWFKGKEAMKLVPFYKDMNKAQSFIRVLRAKYDEDVDKLVNATEILVHNATHARKRTPLGPSPRVVGALPKTRDEWRIALKDGLRPLRLQQTTREVSWLEQNGACIDNIRAGSSTIPQAGRGAFATRPMRKNTVVAPMPLIHIANRSKFDTYEISKTGEVLRDRVVGKQLMLNYCFGHPNSTLLLSPYGYATSLINHDRSRANVKLRWGGPQRSNHHPEWLNFSVKQLDARYVAGLAWELVATRDIKPAEEILMDYGVEWEQAWEQYSKTWSNAYPTSLLSAKELNAMPDILQKLNRTDTRAQLMCYYKFYRKQVWTIHLKKYGNFDGLIRKSKSYPCEVTDWGSDGDDQNSTWYSARYPMDDERLYRVPREAFFFIDRTLPWDNEHAFRHDMRIPDELMPKAWMNRP